jgi:hypothetical protein
MSASKTPNGNFLHSVGNEIALQDDRYTQFEMEKRKNKMM